MAVVGIWVQGRECATSLAELAIRDLPDVLLVHCEGFVRLPTL